MANFETCPNGNTASTSAWSGVLWGGHVNAASDLGEETLETEPKRRHTYTNNADVDLDHRPERSVEEFIC